MTTRSGKPFVEDKNGKNGKKDEDPKEPLPAFKAFIQATSRLETKLEHVTKSNQKLEEIVSSMRDSLREVDEHLTDLKGNFERFDGRLTDLERGVGVYDRRFNDVEKKLIEVTAVMEKYKQKSIDLESRSRRQNLRIFGLPEDIETDDSIKFFTNMLAEMFQGVLKKPPLLDRAHRALKRKPSAEARPHPVILCFLYFQTKEAVICEACKRGKILYKETEIRFVEDYPQEVLAERAKYRDVMTELYKKQYRPSLCYPARLKIFPKDNPPKWFVSPDDAWKLELYPD